MVRRSVKRTESRAFERVDATPASTMAARMPMMAITNSNSMSVNPFRNMCLLYPSLWQVEFAEHVGKGAADLFAGVKEVVRVKYLFDLHKQRVHRGAEHLFHVRRADKPVVMLARDRAAVGKHEVVDSMRKLIYHFFRSGMFGVYKRKDMEVSIAHMTRNCVSKMIFGQ